MELHVDRLAAEDTSVCVRLVTVVHAVKLVRESNPSEKGSIHARVELSFVVLGDACTPNPCLNGASCVSNSFGGFTCQCPPGYSGQRCESRDPCASRPCMNNAVCVSSGANGYTCQCPTGFDGQNCEKGLSIRRAFPFIHVSIQQWISVV